MPLFPYRCEDCGAEFEKLTKAETATKVECVTCGSVNTNRGFGLPQAGKATAPATNCRGDGPPCGAAMCGRGRKG